MRFSLPGIEPGHCNPYPLSIRTELSLLQTLVRRSVTVVSFRITATLDCVNCPEFSLLENIGSVSALRCRERDAHFVGPLVQ
jgi:hypothetical protein